MVCDSTARCPRILLGILPVQSLEITLDARVDLRPECGALVRGAVARFGMDGFALTAVDGAACSRAAVQLLAHHRERPAAGASGCACGRPPSCCDPAGAA